MSPVQNEPSVLDYLKERWAAFWRLDVASEPAAQAAAAEVDGPPATDESVLARPWPWRTLLALTLALLAQDSLEPPRSGPELAVFGFVLAAAFFIWGFAVGEWTPPALPPSASRRDPLTVRRGALLPLSLLVVVLLVLFGGNRFTPLNVTLWLLTLGLFIHAFWLKQPQRGFDWRRWWTPWHVLLLFSAAVVIFIRFYRLAEVPWEPFSDHAEKLRDVYDITQGQWRIFFPRNTGREAFQFYWTLLVAKIFGTGISFQSLKIGTVLIGLIPLPFVYLLGQEVGGSRRVGWLAAFLMGVSYWQNVISRIGLRFPLYPAFTAPALYYLLRGLRTRQRNDFILGGLFLGIGLHGYSPYRIVPVMLVLVLVLYWLHVRQQDARQTLLLFGVLVLASVLVFLPLGRYVLENPGMFSNRMMTRMTSLEQPLPGPAWKIFLHNVWRGLLMFNWDDGEIWVNSVPYRPALGVVCGALFVLGVVLVLVRYARRRDWQDAVLLLAIPVLQLPSTLALAFPRENPALNRTGGAAVVVFLLAALALDAVWQALAAARPPFGRGLALALLALLLSFSTAQNADLVLNRFAAQYDAGTWNSSEMGAVIRDFALANHGAFDHAWIVPYPYWVDTRLPAIWDGIPYGDFAKWRDDLPSTLDVPAPKLFIVKDDDQETLDALQTLYPNGILQLYIARVPHHDFWTFYVFDQ